MIFFREALRRRLFRLTHGRYSSSNDPASTTLLTSCRKRPNVSLLVTKLRWSGKAESSRNLVFNILRPIQPDNTAYPTRTRRPNEPPGTPDSVRGDSICQLFRQFALSRNAATSAAAFVLYSWASGHSNGLVRPAPADFQTTACGVFPRALPTPFPSAEHPMNRRSTSTIALLESRMPTTSHSSVRKD